MINQWYRAKLEYKMGLFQFHVKEEDKVFNEYDDNDIPLVLEGFDSSLAAGSIGIGVNEVSVAEID